MLALLAVAALAASDPTPASPEAILPAPLSLAGRLLEGRRLAGFLRSPSHCSDAARFETGFEPALLFRDQDRDAARLRRLIDLPPAEACLVGAPGEARGAPK